MNTSCSSATANAAASVKESASTAKRTKKFLKPIEDRKVLDEMDLPAALRETEDFKLLAEIRYPVSAVARNNAIKAFIKKYERIMYSYQKKLSNMKKLYGWTNTLEFEDYERNCNEVFMQAINSIDFERLATLKNPAVWFMGQQLCGYFKSHNRNLVNAYLKRVAKIGEVSDETVNSDGKKVYKADIQASIMTTAYNDDANRVNEQARTYLIDRSLARFTPQQRTIWSLKVNGARNQDISKKLGISASKVGTEWDTMVIIIRSTLADMGIKSFGELMPM